MSVTKVPGGRLAVYVPVCGLLQRAQSPEVVRHRRHVHRHEELFGQLEDCQRSVALEIVIWR